jgi:hypothetical protein
MNADDRFLKEIVWKGGSITLYLGFNRCTTVARTDQLGVCHRFPLSRSFISHSSREDVSQARRTEQSSVLRLAALIDLRKSEQTAQACVNAGLVNYPAVSAMTRPDPTETPIAESVKPLSPSQDERHASQKTVTRVTDQL